MEPRSSATTRAPRAGGLALLLLGGSVILGWLVGISRITHLREDWPGMAPITAGMFALFGAALWLRSVPLASPFSALARRGVRVLSILPVVLAVAWLAAHAGDVAHSLHAPLFTSRAGVMVAPITAAAIGLLGGALWASHRPSPVWTQAMALGAMVAGGLGAVRFLYHSPISAYAPMALHTACGVMIAGASILSTRPDASILRILRDPGAGGVMMRRLLPLTIGSPMLSGWILLNVDIDVRTHVLLLAPANALVFAGLVWWAAVAVKRSERVRLAAQEARAEEHARFLAVTSANAEELRERGAALERSNAELERFAQIASHDLQEPLRTISSYVQLLAKRYGDKLDDNATRYIHHVVDGTQRMRALIDALLAYSRVDRTNAPVDEEVALDRVLARVRADLRSSLTDSAAELTSDELPVVQGNEIQLNQLLLNIVGNAIKYRGEAAPRVHVSCAREEPGWRISVKDNGIGIDPQYFERIFVVFQRLHTREVYDGTGVGLAICKRIVERHGGRIWVESAPGAGCTFHFTLKPAEGGPHADHLA